MRTSSASLISAALIAAPLLATLAASTPVINTRSQQIVLSDVEDATRLDPGSRQRDLVDSMIAEAKSKGQDLSAWGIDTTSPSHGDDDDDDDDNNSKNSFAFTESVDLDDEEARIALLMEAAMDNTILTIKPIAKSSIDKWKQKGEKSAAAIADDVVKTMDPPGSGWIWSVCGSGQEAAVLEKLDVSPDPPVAGKNLTVKAKGIVNSPIHKGTYADVVVKLGFIRLISRRFDICDLAEENDAEIKCPVEPGEYEITHTVELPKEIPPAKFNVHVSGKTHEDIDFVCTDLSIDFMHH